MKLKTLLTALAVSVACVAASASAQQENPQTQPGTYQEVHARQDLGRVIASSDGAYFLYEWGRPYLGWAPETKWMASTAARRLQTFLYKVDLSVPDPTSEYLFYPNAGCTYWLGDLSPDNANVIVYELDHDDRRIRAGVWNFPQQKMRWFTPRPDEERLEERTAWISNDEFVYPVKGKVPLVKAVVLTGEAPSCVTCTMEMVRQARKDMSEIERHVREVAGHISASDAPVGAQLVTGAANGSVAIFVQDTDEVLSLLYKRADQPMQVVFENTRRWEPPRAAK